MDITYYSNNDISFEAYYGDKFWYQNGVIHRVNGPAAERNDGVKLWHQNGELHRENGPAIERTDGMQFWCLNGYYYTEEQFINRNKTK